MCPSTAHPLPIHCPSTCGGQGATQQHRITSHPLICLCSILKTPMASASPALHRGMLVAAQDGPDEWLRLHRRICRVVGELGGCAATRRRDDKLAVLPLICCQQNLRQALAESRNGEFPPIAAAHQLLHIPLQSACTSRRLIRPSAPHLPGQHRKLTAALILAKRNVQRMTCMVLLRTCSHCGPAVH
jgi:hypothetical protein